MLNTFNNISKSKFNDIKSIKRKSDDILDELAENYYYEEEAILTAKNYDGTKKNKIFMNNIKKINIKFENKEENSISNIKEDNNYFQILKKLKRRKIY